MKSRYDKNQLEALHFQVADLIVVKRTPPIRGVTNEKLVQKYIGHIKIETVLPKGPL